MFSGTRLGKCCSIIRFVTLHWNDSFTCLPPPLGCNFLKGEKCISFLLLSPALSTVLPRAGPSTDLVQVTDSFHLFSPCMRLLASLFPVLASFLLLQASLFALLPVTLHPLWQYYYWVICSDLLAKHWNGQSSTDGQFLHCSYSPFQVMSSRPTASNIAEANGSNACVPFYVRLFSWVEAHNKLPVPEPPLGAVFIKPRRKLGFYSANLLIVQLAHHTTPASSSHPNSRTVSFLSLSIHWYLVLVPGLW